MNKEEIIAELRRVALEHGGEPLGERLFYRETGLTLVTLRRGGFANYGQVREAAGFGRGTMRQSYSDDELFKPLATLARERGHFPTKGEIEVAQYSLGNPSYSAYSRSTKRGPLRIRFIEWCRTNPAFADLVPMLDGATDERSGSVRTRQSSAKVVNGFVYLLRYGASGRDYKIGCTDNVDRRKSQIDMMSPADVRRVHVIETDDPRGIEKYWMERFADKRIRNKEIFRLTTEDVAAFKRRRYQ